MRAIGRRESDSSPHNSLVNGWPARIPLSMRMVEPEFPQSSTSAGGFSRGPTPRTSIARAGAISRRGKILETAGTLRNRRQHGVAVRNGLVPRNADDSAHHARRTDDDIRTVRLRIIRHEFNITEISDASGPGLLRAHSTGGFRQDLLRNFPQRDVEFEHGRFRPAPGCGRDDKQRSRAPSELLPNARGRTSLLAAPSG